MAHPLGELSQGRRTEWTALKGLRRGSPGKVGSIDQLDVHPGEHVEIADVDRFAGCEEPGGKGETFAILKPPIKFRSFGFFLGRASISRGDFGA